MNALETRRRLLLGSVPHEYILTKEGVPPLSFYSNGKPLLSYEIAGNTVQDGEPSPDNPVEIIGVGEKTGNLFDSNSKNILYGKALTPEGQAAETNSRFTSHYIDVSEMSSICVYGKTTFNNCFYTEQSEQAFLATVSKKEGEVAIPHGSKYYRFSANLTDIETAMVNSGSEPLPYEPYGYKIPITCGGEAKNIYLNSQLMQGEVLKSNGERNIEWAEEILIGSFGNQNHVDTDELTTFSYSGIEGTGIGNRKSFCSHFPYSNSAQTSSVVSSGFNHNPSYSNFFYIRIKFETFGSSRSDSSATRNDKFNAWLAEQYSKGTPVILYYQVASPTTETVTTPEIPTLKGTNILTVDTEVQPSNVKIEYRSGRKG